MNKVLVIGIAGGSGSGRIININDKIRAHSNAYIYKNFKETIRQYFFTNKIRGLPDFQYFDRLCFDRIIRSMLDRYNESWSNLKDEEILNGIECIYKYINTNIDSKKFRNTYDEIIKADYGIAGYVPFDKSKCDPESAILLFLIKKLRNGMIVRDITPHSYYNELEHGNLFTTYLKEALGPDKFKWGILHIRVFNYVYAKYIEYYYYYLKESFYNNNSCDFPKTARDEIKEEMCKFPAYIMFYQGSNVELYKGTDEYFVN